MSLRSIIVDDELMARESLEHMCSKSEDIDLLGLCENAHAAIEILNKNKVDLIFLDIEMPGMTGLELLEEISILPQVVFITSNKDYAYEAYEYDVTDFLKKPITQNRFQRAIQKAVERELQLKSIAESSRDNEIYVRSDNKLIRVAYYDINYFENVGDYIKITTDKESYLVYATLKSVYSKLSSTRFLKVHRSFIINLDKVVDIQDNTLIINKKLIPVSRAHKSILLSTINIL